MNRSAMLEQVLTVEEAYREGLQILERSQLCLVGSNNGQGYPQIKAMFKLTHEGLTRVWFSTNTASERVTQFLRDPKAAVYFYDEQYFKGLLLTGEMQVLQDSATKTRFWVEGSELYYPLGVDDPDYSVLQFSAKSANYYNRLQNVTFAVG
ncbi:MAG TPA: pyridoxamine 5'-phosphate oxidase family protein [Bacillota bacterium]|nr:pyridoxamine 5'-phosphate oxidase family protein [Bacillota bacterium]